MENLELVKNALKAILVAIGGFLGWQGGYQLLSSKTEHKPDQGTDAWWTIGLGVFCIATGASAFLDTIFEGLMNFGG